MPDAEPVCGSSMQQSPSKPVMKKLAATLLAFSVPQFLKGAALSTITQESNDELSWVRIAGMIVGVVLLWEAVKTVARPCLRVLGVVQDGAELPTPVDVRVIAFPWCSK